MAHLHTLVTDPTEKEFEQSEPLLQLLMNSHSPVVLSALRDERNCQVLFADLVAVVDPVKKHVRRKTRIRPVFPKDQGELFPVGEDVVSRFEVQRILDTVNQEA